MISNDERLARELQDEELAYYAQAQERARACARASRTSTDAAFAQALAQQLALEEDEEESSGCSCCSCCCECDSEEVFDEEESSRFCCECECDSEEDSDEETESAATSEGESLYVHLSDGRDLKVHRRRSDGALCYRDARKEKKVRANQIVGSDKRDDPQERRQRAREAFSPEAKTANSAKKKKTTAQKKTDSMDLRPRRPDGARLQGVEAKSQKVLEDLVRSYKNDTHHKLLLIRGGGTINPGQRRKQYFGEGYTGLLLYSSTAKMKSKETFLLRMLREYGHDANTTNVHRVSNLRDEPGYIYVILGEHHNKNPKKRTSC